jgi:hypothetical protein
MKIVKFRYPHLLLLIIISFLLSGCSLFEEEVESEPDIPDNWLEHSYLGTLTVRFTNTYPEWDESATMDVDIDKVTGLVTFSGTTLSYSGETIVSPDSKITRSGNWSIDPTGLLIDDDGTVYMQVDAHVVVNSDVQRIYAKNNKGEWQLVNETDFASTPNSDLSFILDDAVINGSVVSAESELGSITWVLRLTPALD